RRKPLSPTAKPTALSPQLKTWPTSKVSARARLRRTQTASLSNNLIGAASAAPSPRHWNCLAATVNLPRFGSLSLATSHDARRAFGCAGIAALGRHGHCCEISVLRHRVVGHHPRLFEATGCAAVFLAVDAARTAATP